MMAHPVIIFVGILTVVFSIFVIDARIFLAQMVFSLIFPFVTNSPVLFNLLNVLQVLLAVYALYRCKKAVDYDYQLVLEKTHKIPQNITKGGYLGGEFSLFKKTY